MNTYKNKIIIPVVKIMVFSMIFIILFNYLTYLMKPDTIELRTVAGFYGEKRNSLDMVYIGGSASFVYWAPLRAWKNEGIASYNYCSNRIQAEIYQYMIKEVFKYQKPKLIIIDARAFEYRDVAQPPNEVSYRNILTGMPFSKNKIDFITDAVPKYLKEGRLSYYFDLIKYHRPPEDIQFMVSLKMMLNKYENPQKGFYFVPKVEHMQPKDFSTDMVTAISDETNQILENLLEYLNTIKGTNFLFVVSPYIQDKNQKERLNYVQSIIEEKGYDFLDANEYYDEMNLDFSTDFYNISHVNIYGAEKYTDFLTGYIKENYNLINRLNNKNYQKWNDLLELWEKDVKATKAIIDKKLVEK